MSKKRFKVGDIARVVHDEEPSFVGRKVRITKVFNPWGAYDYSTELVEVYPEDAYTESGFDDWELAPYSPTGEKGIA